MGLTLPGDGATVSTNLRSWIRDYESRRDNPEFLANCIFGGFGSDYAEADLALVLAALPQEVLDVMTQLVAAAPRTDEEWAGCRSTWGPAMGFENSSFLFAEQEMTERQKHWYRIVVAFRRVITSSR